MKKLILSIFFIFSIVFVYGQRIIDANRVIVRDSINLNGEEIKLSGAANGDVIQRIDGSWTNNSVLLFDSIDYNVNNNGYQRFLLEGIVLDSVLIASGASTDHAILTNLSWTTSGHTGTASAIAAFDGTGATTNITPSSYPVSNFQDNGTYLDAATHNAAGLTTQYVGITNIQTLTNKTLTTPTISDYTNATHTHSSNASGGLINSDNITHGTTNLFSQWSNEITDGIYNSTTDHVSIGMNGATSYKLNIDGGTKSGLYVDMTSESSINRLVRFYSGTSEKFEFWADGHLSLNKYGDGTFTGTPTYNAVFDASGNLIEGSLGGSGATQLSELSDVNTSTPTNKNFLIADGVDWESRAASSSDLSDLSAINTYFLPYKTSTTYSNSPIQTNGTTVAIGSTANTTRNFYSLSSNSAISAGLFRNNTTTGTGLEVWGGSSSGGIALTVWDYDNTNSLFRVDGTGEIYMPNIDAATSTNVIYYNTSTKELTYGAAPAGSSPTLANIATNSTTTAHQTFALNSGTELIFEGSTGTDWFKLTESSGEMYSYLSTVDRLQLTSSSFYIDASGSDMIFRDVNNSTPVTLSALLAGGSSPWTDAGTYLYPTSSENVHIGGSASISENLRVTRTATGGNAARIEATATGSIALWLNGDGDDLYLGGTGTIEAKELSTLATTSSTSSTLWQSKDDILYVANNNSAISAAGAAPITLHTTNRSIGEHEYTAITDRGTVSNPLYLPEFNITGRILVIVNRSSDACTLKNDDNTATITYYTFSGTSTTVPANSSITIQYNGSNWYQIH